MNAPKSLIKGSEGATIITGSSSFDIVWIYFVATAIAGAVFFATGSAKTFAFLLKACNWNLTFERCFVFVILIIFSDGAKQANLSNVDWIKLFSIFKFNNCFG